MFTVTEGEGCGKSGLTKQTPLSHYLWQFGAEFEFLVRPRVGDTLELLIFVVIWIGSAEEQHDHDVPSPDCQSLPNLSQCSGPVRLDYLEHRHIHLSFMIFASIPWWTTRSYWRQSLYCGALQSCQMCSSSTASLSSACTIREWRDSW